MILIHRKQSVAERTTFALHFAVYLKIIILINVRANNRRHEATEIVASESSQLNLTPIPNSFWNGACEGVVIEPNSLEKRVEASVSNVYQNQQKTRMSQQILFASPPIFSTAQSIVGVSHSIG